MIAITGGGTGGHLSVAKAIANECQKRGIKTIFIGSTNGQDRLWFENSAFFEKTYFLETHGVVNKKGFAKLKSLWNIYKATKQTKKIFKENGVNAVFSVGGYSAAPASFCAVINKIPLYIHEQNAAFGRLNRILKPYSKHFFNSFCNDCTYTNYPVLDSFFEQKRERKSLECILFMGGSQGSSAINNLAKKLAVELNNKNIKIIHQCGKNSYYELQKFYKDNDIDVDLFDFTKDILSKINKADLAIARAGAGSIWEFSANGLPAIFIPLPNSANNHQYLNATHLVLKKSAILIEESKINTENFCEIIKKLDINLMSKNALTCISSGGAKEMLDIIQKEQHNL